LLSWGDYNIPIQLIKNRLINILYNLDSLMMTYPERKTIYVDVDGTLLIKDRINIKLVSYIKSKKREGYDINIWSMRGKKYAEKWMIRAGLKYDVTHCLSKPGMIIDDEGWNWIKNCRVTKRCPKH